VISEEKKKVLEFFAQGRRSYKLWKFAEARAAFAQALEVDPGDGPSKEYLKRCDRLIKEPPRPDWDGVYTMETK
jgi:hypothetical protein